MGPFEDQNQSCKDNADVSSPSSKPKFKFLKRGEGTYKRVYASRFRKPRVVTCGDVVDTETPCMDVLSTATNVRAGGLDPGSSRSADPVDLSESSDAAAFGSTGREPTSATLQGHVDLPSGAGQSAARYQSRQVRVPLELSAC